MLRTDEHQAYRRAVAEHGAFQRLWQMGRTRHETTSSTEARTWANPLAPVNYMDRELRKDLAEHVRESTRFSRSVHGTMDRLHTYLLVHNIAKRYRIDRPKRECYRTHAGEAGIASMVLGEILQWVFHRRAFRSRSALRGPLVWQWLRMHTTPLEKRRAYLPQYMLA